MQEAVRCGDGGRDEGKEGCASRQQVGGDVKATEEQSGATREQVVGDVTAAEERVLRKTPAGGG